MTTQEAGSAMQGLSAAALDYAARCEKGTKAAYERCRSQIGVPYGAHPRQSLDIFLPDDRELKDAPVLMFMHGGGWTAGFKEWGGFMAPPFVAAGAIFVSVGYRLIPEVSFPEPVKDVIDALAWMQAHARELGGSPDRIFLAGHSAGAQIAALVPLMPERLAAAGLKRDAVKGAFCLAGTFNRRMVKPEVAPDHVQPGPQTAIQPESPLALAAQANVPFLIAWGDKDDERVERTGRQMIAALKDVGCPAQVQVFPGDDHFSVHLGTANADNSWTRQVLATMGVNPPRAK